MSLDILDRLSFRGGRTLPLILQTEATECALACLAMIAGYHGYETDLPALRRRFGISMKGATMRRLIEIAEQLQLSARPVRLEHQDEIWKELKCPAILHWDLNHFVVVKRADRRTLVIHDPGLGERTMTYQEASPHITGVAVVITPTATFTKQAPTPRVTLSQLTGPIRGLWPALAQLLALSLVLQLVTILSPFYMQWTVDQALLAGDRNLLSVLAIGFAWLVAFGVVVSLVRGWIVLRVSTALNAQWMSNLLTHLLRLPTSFFQKRRTGDILSRFGDLKTIQTTISTGFVEAIVDGVMALATLGMMLAYSVKLAVVTLVAVALYLALRLLAYRPLRAASQKQLNGQAKQDSHLLETLRGIQSIQMTGTETLRRVGWQNLFVDTLNRSIEIAKFNLGFGAANQLVFGLERILVIWLGAMLTLDAVFSVGMLFAYLSYKDQFATRISSVVDRALAFRMLRLNAERLADIALAEPEAIFLPEGQGGRTATARTGEIRVRGLGFRYADGDPWILKGLDLTITPGQSVAIVGSSGCGKTTLVKLLAGLLSPTEGEILLGGVPYARLDRQSFRDTVAAVMQDDQLFTGSILENIASFEAGASPERVREAAQLAGVHDEIQAMAMQYQTFIGDMGSALSGGQRQRILLARALYRRSQVLLLDEATSNLDVARERLVNDAVKNLNITRIIIAHRPETINSADRVLMMAGGRIAREVVPSRPAAASPVQQPT